MCTRVADPYSGILVGSVFDFEECGSENGFFPPIDRIRVQNHSNAVCPRSSGTFYIVTYYIKWVTNGQTVCTNFFSSIFLGTSDQKVRFLQQFLDPNISGGSEPDPLM